MKEWLTPAPIAASGLQLMGTDSTSTGIFRRKIPYYLSVTATQDKLIGIRYPKGKKTLNYNVIPTAKL